MGGCNGWNMKDGKKCEGYADYSYYIMLGNIEIEVWLCEDCHENEKDKK